MLDRITDNPILVKHGRSRLRRPKTLPAVVVLMLMCVCIMWGALAADGLDDGWPFTVFVLLQGAVLLLNGTVQVVTSVGKANDSGILDFHRASPRPPIDHAVGFLLGAPIREYLMFGMVGLFTFLCSALGRPGLGGFVIVEGILLTSALLFHALAMVTALVIQKQRNASGGITVLIFAAHFMAFAVYQGIALPGLLTPIPSFVEVMERAFGSFTPPDGQPPTFFGAALPLALQTLIYQVPILVLLMVAAVRRMASDRAALYSRPTAVAALVIVAILAMGGIVGHPRISGRIASPIVVYILGFVSLFLILATTPDSRGFANGARRAAKLGRARLRPDHDLASNRSLVIVFAGLVVLGGLIARSLGTGQQALPGRSLPMGLAIAGAGVLCFGFALQFFALEFRRRAMPYFVLLLFVAWVLPLMVAGLLGHSFGPRVAEAVFSVSPIVGVVLPTSISLIVNGVLALAFGTMLLAQERELEEHVRGGGGRTTLA